MRCLRERERERESKTHRDIDSLIEYLLSQITILQSKLDPLLCHTEALQKVGVSQNANNRDSLITLLKHIPTPPQQGWERVAISQIAEKLLAGGDKPEVFSETKTQECFIPIYANAIEKQGLYGYTNEPTITQNAVTISARGTIGYAVARFEPFYPIVRLIVLIPNRNSNLKFLELVLNNNKIEQSGVNIPQLTLPQFSNLKIPLPPLNEQEKISHCIEKIESQISNLNQAILQISNQKAQILEKFLK